MSSGSLLPANASALERSLDTLAEKSTALPVAIKTLWDPFSCPITHLPWLAWAVSVDEWNDDWPELIKRQVVQDAFEVHRFKGTPYAVQKALDSLGIKTQLREWWETGGSGIPGTLTIEAILNENLTEGAGGGLLTDAMLEQVKRSITNAKRGVIHFDVELGAHLDERVGLTGAGSMLYVGDFDLHTTAVVPHESCGGLYAFCAVRSLAASSIELEGKP